MSVAVGSAVPDVAVQVLRDGAPVSVQSGELLGKGKVVLLAVPGAFTPTCSNVHLPGYVKRAAELKAKGVDTIACISVNDAWVMDEWGKAQGVGDDIVLIADGNGAFTDAMGLGFEVAAIGLRARSQRYAALIDNGVITELDIEPGPGVTISGCDTMLEKV
jgi:peroxiredoxin